jgi:hypothetical protein
MTDELPSIVEFSVDLNKQEEPEPLPAGEYTGVIRSAVQKTSQKGTRYGEIAFFIDSDQYPADYTEGNPDGTTLYYRRVSFEDNPMARYGTRRFCEAISAPLGKKVDLNEWVGLEAVVEITHETYEGSRRANINRVRAS